MSSHRRQIDPRCLHFGSGVATDVRKDQGEKINRGRVNKINISLMKINGRNDRIELFCNGITGDYTGTQLSYSCAVTTHKLC